jgi:branched-chain amino acid transport system substrate-binding protein
VSSATPSRRAFLLGAGAAAALLAQAARAEDTYAVGLVLPGDGSMALEQGALLGLDEANALATLFGKRVRLETERAADAAGAARAGAALARSGVLALVGGAGGGVADALRDAAAPGGPLFLNVAALDDRLRQERCDAQMFHFAPSVSMYVDAAALWADRRRLVRWAVTGDGTPRAREVEAAVRRALTRRPGATLVADDSADLVFLAGEGASARDALARARAAGRGDSLMGIGGDIPDALPPGEAAGLWIVGWNRELERFSASELNGRVVRRFNRPLTETSWAAWAALKLVGEALVRASAASAADLRAFLESSPPFDGHKGAPLTFRPWDHQLRQPVYVIGPRKRAEGGAGESGGFTVLGDLPGANLDAIGILAADSRCRFSR